MVRVVTVSSLCAYRAQKARIVILAGRCGLSVKKQGRGARESRVIRVQGKVSVGECARWMQRPESVLLVGCPGLYRGRGLYSNIYYNIHTSVTRGFVSVRGTPISVSSRYSLLLVFLF